jgi:hypothetical protein
MMWWEIVAVWSQIHKKHIITLRWQNMELLNVKPGSNRRILKGLFNEAINPLNAELNPISHVSHVWRTATTLCCSDLFNALWRWRLTALYIKFLLVPRSKHFPSGL